MQIDVNQKPSKSFKIFQISLFQLIFILRSSWTSGSWRISRLEKPVPMFSKTLSLDITRPQNLLLFENISKFYYVWLVKGQDTTSKTQRLILI